MPFQNNTNFGIGSNDRTQNVLNIQPVIPVSFGKWNLINRTIVPLIYQPDLSQQSGGEFGLGDINPNRKIFEARKRETAALGTGEKLVLGHPLAATIGDSARCMQNLEKVLFTGPKTSDTVTFICD